MLTMRMLSNMSIKECQKRITIEKLLFFIVLTVNVGIVFICFSQGIIGNDYWWHLKTGEWIVQNGRIPNKDIFSWIGKDLNIDWIPHEWLSDVIFFLVFHFGGHSAVYIIVLLLAVGFIIICHRILREAFEKNALVTGCFLVFMSVIAAGAFYPRPQIFSYFIFLFIIWCLYRFFEQKSKMTLYFIPIVTILWSNLHGGFAMLSYTLCFGLFVLSFLPNKGRMGTFSINREQRIQLLITTVLSVLAIVINPLGFKALIYPFLNQGDKLMISAISEWKAPDCKMIGELVLYFVPIAFAIALYINCWKRIRILDFVLFGLFVFLFLRSVRFIILWYIFMLFGGLKYVPILKIKKPKNFVEYTSIACVVLATFVFLFYGLIGSINTIATSSHPIRSDVSDKMIQYVKNDVSTKRLYNDYDYGGELIFNDIPVFFDSRADLYASQSLMKDGLEILYLMPFDNDNIVDINGLLTKYKIERILVKKNRALYTYLNSNEQKYIMKYSDENSAYFECVN